jgi:hypothetical protein
MFSGNQIVNIILASLRAIFYLWSYNIYIL